MTQAEYELLTQKLLRKARSLRFQYAGRPEIESYGIEKAINEQLFNIGGSEYDQYRWLVTELNSMAEKATKEIVEKNLSEKKIEYTEVPANILNPCAFCYIIAHRGERLLVLFRNFGIRNAIRNSDLIAEILKQFNAQHYMYVTLVKDYAYLENVEHNDNQNDPSRGTGVYSIKFFFEYFFGPGEAESYIDFSETIKKGFKECLGISSSSIGNSVTRFP